jgi:hypothetical protein
MSVAQPYKAVFKYVDFSRYVQQLCFYGLELPPEHCP